MNRLCCIHLGDTFFTSYVSFRRQCLFFLPVMLSLEGSASNCKYSISSYRNINRDLYMRHVSLGDDC
jgi:hypothetical protein